MQNQFLFETDEFGYGSELENSYESFEEEFERSDEYESDFEYESDYEDEGEIRRKRGRSTRRPSGAIRRRKPPVRSRRRRPPSPGRRPSKRPYPPVFPASAGTSTFDPEPFPIPEESKWIRLVQKLLNKVMGLNLPVDGFLTVETRSAIRSFQSQSDSPSNNEPARPGEPAGGGGEGDPPAQATGPEDGPQSEYDEFEFYDTESDYLELEQEVSRSSKTYKKWVQQALNRTMGLNLAVDGIVGPKTRSAIRSFQQRRGLKVDGIVGSQTEATLIMVTGMLPPSGPSVMPGSGGGTASSINSPLPLSGPGFFSYNRQTSRQYGIPETIQALKAIASAWYLAHPQGPRIGFGDISFKGGGTMPPHVSHKNGVDIDIRLMRNDGSEKPTNFNAAEYSRPLTQELVNLIRNNGILAVRYIFFNDPQVTGVKYQKGHHNHLHVRFCAPGDQACIRQSQKEFEFESSGWAGSDMY